MSYIIYKRNRNKFITGLKDAAKKAYYNKYSVNEWKSNSRQTLKLINEVINGKRSKERIWDTFKENEVAAGYQSGFSYARGQVRNQGLESNDRPKRNGKCF